MARALIIDDEEMVRAVLASYLRRNGHEALLAEHGRKGLELLAERPDIVFCDYNMPIMDGYEFCQALKTDPACAAAASIPVIGTGQFPEDRQEYLAERLRKPFLPQELLRCIEQYVPKSAVATNGV